MATTEDPEAVGGVDEWRRDRFESSPERSGELFSTMSGVENEPLYAPENVHVEYERDLGYPGAFPFTRGVYPSMYRGRLWTMRQFAGFGTAEETNERFRYLLEHGQTGLSTAFDMPTLMGYDCGPSALARRGRTRGCGGGFARRHGDVVRGHSAGRCVDVDDDQLAGCDVARVLRVRRRGAGRVDCATARDRADGHPQGVHRAEGMDLSAGAVVASRRRHDRVVRARDAVDASGVDLRLPHPRSGIDGGSGVGVHARRRFRVRRRMSSNAGWMSTSLRRGCRSSSTRIWTSSRRSRSTVRRVASGRR